MYSKLTNTYFFTATINNWQHLLIPDYRKQIVFDALKFLSQEKKILLHSYVIMPNHVHLLLSLPDSINFKMFQISFLRFTAQELIREIKNRNELETFKTYISTQSDRTIHIWERRPKWITIDNIPIYKQKLEYIHNNPIQEHWLLSKRPEDYSWSSCHFYEGRNTENMSFLTILD